MASSLDAVDTLAGFGISFGIIKLTAGMISEIKMASIMLLHNHSDRMKIGICVLLSGCLVTVFSVTISKFNWFSYSIAMQWLVVIFTYSFIHILIVEVFS